MIQKDGSILISSNDFIKGIAKSPYLGIAKMVNLDIHSLPGVVQIAHQLEKSSGSTVTEWVRFADYDPFGNVIYSQDQDGVLYSYDVSSGTWAVANDFDTTRDGMFVWKNYVIAMRNGTSSPLFQAYGPLTGGTAAERTFLTPSTTTRTGATYVSLITLDDKVFIGVDNYLHELVENSGQNFDPTSSGTYTFSEKVLILPENLTITSLAESGTNIVIGTTYDQNRGVDADYFIWNPNKSGTDATAPDERIRLSGNGVQKIEVSNNLAHILVGDNGNLIVTDTTNVKEIAELKSISKDTDTGFEYIPIVDSSDTYDSGLLFGVTKTVADIPIYQYKNKALTSFTTSQGEDDVLNIGAVKAISDSQFFVGWENSTDGTWGVDVTSTTSRYQGYTAYFESQIYTTSREMNGKSYSEIGFTLGKPLQANQGIRFKYRTGLGEDWTTLKTIDYDTVGAVLGHRTTAELPTSFQSLQLRVELTTGTTDTTPLLKEVYLI